MSDISGLIIIGITKRAKFDKSDTGSTKPVTTTVLNKKVKGKRKPVSRDVAVQTASRLSAVTLPGDNTVSINAVAEKPVRVEAI